MRRHLTNAAYGVLDYASYPVTMLLVAPIVLRKLGTAEYGLWIMAASVISAGGILASGFCDAAMQRIARLRGEGNIGAAALTVRSILTINLTSGVLLALAIWIAAPVASIHLTTSRQTSERECLYSLVISGSWVVLRSVDSVAVITHRAFEQYRETVQISVASRLLTLSAAAILAMLNFRVLAILSATGAALALGTYLQFARLRAYFGKLSLWPAYDPEEIRLLLHPGLFVWLQSACGVVFGHLDRILLAVSLGPASLAPYALCVQFAQPIFGLSASALHFIFPLISRRAPNISTTSLGHLLVKSVLGNLFLVIITSTTLLAVGSSAIRLWSGGIISAHALKIFPGVVLGSAFMGLGVTGTYAMQALGEFRKVALLNIGGRICALILLVYLLAQYGIHGVIVARLCYGATALLVYIPLLHHLWVSMPQRGASAGRASALQEAEP